MGLEKDRNGIGWVKIYLGMRRKLKWEREGWVEDFGWFGVDRYCVTATKTKKLKKYKNCEKNYLVARKNSCRTE